MVNLLKRWGSIFFNRASISLEFPLMAGYVTLLSTSPTADLAIFALVYSLFAWIESPFMMSDVVMIKTLHAGSRPIEGIKCTLILAIAPVSIFFTCWLFSEPWLSILNKESAVLWSEVLPYLGIMVLALPISTARRALNGVATFHHKESVLHKGMWVKIVLMILVLFLSILMQIHVVTSACLALIAGVIGETAYLYKKAHSLEVAKNVIEKTVTMSSWFKDLSPLALMSFVSLGIGGIITIALSLGANPEENVAIFALLNGIITIFKHAPMSIQSIWVNTLNGNSIVERKTKHLFVLVFGLTLVTTLLYYIGFNDIYIYHFNNIDPHNEKSVFWVFALLSASVLLTFYVIYYRGILIHSNRSKQLNKATVLELIAFIATAAVLIFSLKINPAVACAGSVFMGRLSTIILMKSSLLLTNK